MFPHLRNVIVAPPFSRGGPTTSIPIRGPAASSSRPGRGRNMKAGEEASPTHDFGNSMAAQHREDGPNPLVRVCSLLNKHGAKYLVAGGHACILHGMVRTTEDVDILVEESDENYAKVIAALAEMEDGAAAELVPADIRNNVVVKIADEVEVDVSRRAWVVTFAEAIPQALATEVDKVRIPYLGLADLIRSKQTYREQDRADLLRLQHLEARKSSSV